MQTRQAYIFLGLTMLMWGCNFIVGRLAIGNVTPMMLNMLRWAVAALVLSWLARDRLRAQWPVLRANAGILAILGTLGMTGYGVALFAALTRTTAINAAIVQASMPVVVFAASLAFFGQRVFGGQVVGFLLSIAGVVVTVSHGDVAQLASLSLNAGDALMLVAVLCYGAYTALLRFRPAMHWQTFMLAVVLVGFLTSAPFAAAEWQLGTGHAPTTTGWLLVLFSGLFPSLLAQVFYVRGVELIGPNRAGLFINLVPLFATFLSIAVLGEAFHLYHAAALALVLGGIAIAERSGKRQA